MWGEFNAYQTRFGVFVNGEHVAFVIRTRRDELTFSDFLSWEDREVYMAFLGFSMAAVDAVLGGPARHYSNRVRNIINRICPPDNRKINVNGQPHPVVFSTRRHLESFGLAPAITSTSLQTKTMSLRRFEHESSC